MVTVMKLTDPNSDAWIARCFGKAPILIQLPTVFAVFAPATVQGASLLDRCKARLPGKHYGVIVGDIRKFLRLSAGAPLADYLLQSDAPDRVQAFAKDMRCTFLRMQVGPRGHNSKVVCDGTLQGLILDGVLSEKMQLMEELSESLEGKLFGRDHGHYCAPIGSSCNMSGDPAGSITDFDAALAFARKRGVELMLTHDAANAKGSQPILGVRGGGVATFRDGPGAMEKRGLLNSWLERAQAYQDHRKACNPALHRPADLMSPARFGQPSGLG